MEVLYNENQIRVKEFLQEQPFSLEETLECGQCFRFIQVAENRYQGMTKDIFIDVATEKDDLVFHGMNEVLFKTVASPYFELSRDYVEIQNTLSRNPVMRKAISYAPGIRVLNQDPWETLCTFLFSQNNHIKRIAGIVERFCENFGTQTASGRYAFPTVEQIVPLDVEDLAPVRAGFRAKYIVDAASKVASGVVDLSLLKEMPLEESELYLQQISGVGPKVADCILLFGGGHLDAFPKDVWILRAMENLFPKGLPKYMLPYAGIAQQYIFHYIRNSPECESLRKKKSTTQ